MRMTLRLLVVALVAATVAVAGPSAQAQTVTKSDPRPGCSQAAPLDLVRATFDYRPGSLTVRTKIGRLSRSRTQVIARYTHSVGGDTRFDLLMSTKYVGGVRRTVARWTNYATGRSGSFTRGVRAVWDFERDVITFTLTQRLYGDRVLAAAYTVPKGADHGPPCGDYITVGSLRRG
jgi:hypothetical protein